MKRVSKFVVGLVAGLMLTLTSCSQELQYSVVDDGPGYQTVHINEETLKVSDGLLPNVLEFLMEAHRYEHDVENLTKHLDSIVYGPLTAEFAGVTFVPEAFNMYTLINYRAIDYPEFQRIIVFHELGHAYLGRRHCHSICDEVMSSILGWKKVRNNWEETKEVFFKNSSHNYTRK